MTRRTYTDAELEAALIATMEKACARAPESKREYMEPELPRLRAGGWCATEDRPEAFQAMRDFIEHLESAPLPTRRRNMPREQADAIAARVAARAAKNARKGRS